jgi:hypothetical protein
MPMAQNCFATAFSVRNQLSCGGLPAKLTLVVCSCGGRSKHSLLSRLPKKKCSRLSFSSTLASTYSHRNGVTYAYPAV